MATPTLDEFQRQYDKLADKAGKVLDLTDRSLALDDMQAAALGIVRRDTGELQAALEAANATIDAAVLAARREADERSIEARAVRGTPSARERSSEFVPLVVPSVDEVAPVAEPLPDAGYRTALRRLSRRAAQLAAVVRRADERQRELGLRLPPRSRLPHTPNTVELPDGLPAVAEAAVSAAGTFVNGGVELVGTGIHELDVRTARLRRLYLGEANRVAGLRHRV